MGKVTQAVFAVIAPGNATTNLMAAGATSRTSSAPQGSAAGSQAMAAPPVKAARLRGR